MLDTELTGGVTDVSVSTSASSNNTSTSGNGATDSGGPGGSPVKAAAPRRRRAASRPAGPPPAAADQGDTPSDAGADGPAASHTGDGNGPAEPPATSGSDGAGGTADDAPATPPRARTRRPSKKAAAAAAEAARTEAYEPERLAEPWVPAPIPSDPPGEPESQGGLFGIDPASAEVPAKPAPARRSRAKKAAAVVDAAPEQAEPGSADVSQPPPLPAATAPGTAAPDGGPEQAADEPAAKPARARRSRAKKAVAPEPDSETGGAGDTESRGAPGSPGAAVPDPAAAMSVLPDAPPAPDADVDAELADDAVRTDDAALAGAAALPDVREADIRPADGAGAGAPQAGQPTQAAAPAFAADLLFQPPAAATPRRRRAKAAAAAAAPEGIPAETAESAASEAAVALVEDLTDEAAVDAPVADGAEPELAEAPDGAETPDGAEEAEGTEESAESGPDGEPRRRRRRGGRGRRRTRSEEEGATGEDREGEAGSAMDGDAAAPVAPAATGSTDGAATGTADDAGQEGGADAGEPAEAGSASSRRRRRRRRGAGGSDEPEGQVDERTVVHVREPRKQREPREPREPKEQRESGDVTAIRGSTRLEAKKQRRREGRDSGRRRTAVISESEFLARRESVHREMVMRQAGDRTQIAVLEDGVLVEHYVNRESSTSFVGNVYLGKVQNVLPSMEAAFVDIGKARNAVLYAGEVNWDAAGLDGQPKRIESALKSGDSVLVQVTKDPIGHKGSRLTSQISLPGRYLVLVPDGSMTGISRKLPETERARLKAILKQVVPEEAGVIVRTAAEGASEVELERDVARLTGQWEAIQKAARGASAPALLHGEPDLTVRVIRDVFNEDFAKLVVSGDAAWDIVEPYVSSVAPDLAPRLEKWVGAGDMWSSYRIDEQLAKALDRKVWLPSGGSLVIDDTEAMTVVDVNTGKFTGKGGNLEETVTKNNLEAAEEIVRQLRLRDIGGIIVVDFIDMVLEGNRELVLRRLLECLGRDRTKHQVAEVTSLGLVQMTRKRVGQGLLATFSETCEHCHGRGHIVHLEPVDDRPLSERGPVRSGRAPSPAAVARVIAAAPHPPAPTPGPADPTVAGPPEVAELAEIAGLPEVAELSAGDDTGEADPVGAGTGPEPDADVTDALAEVIEALTDTEPSPDVPIAPAADVAESAPDSPLVPAVDVDEFEPESPLVPAKRPRRTRRPVARG